ncbi:MAG: hypothetical protein ACXWP4_16175 [Polyangiales bacterium]
MHFSAKNLGFVAMQRDRMLALKLQEARAMKIRIRIRETKCKFCGGFCGDPGNCRC